MVIGRKIGWDLIRTYGLFQESTIPDWDYLRHTMISWVSLISYIVTEFATASVR